MIMSSTLRHHLGAGSALLATAALAIAGMPSPAVAGAPTGVVIDYDGFDDAAGLALNGATVVNGSLRLTGRAPHSAASAWSTTMVATDGSFTTTFELSLGRHGGFGDGVAFVLQNVGTDVLGWGGGGLGYRTIAPSVAIEFDTYQNAYETDGNHVALVIDGDVEAATTTKQIPFSLYKGAVQSTVSYDAATTKLRVWVKRVGQLGKGTLAVEQRIDLTEALGGDSAYAGFTGATGSNFALQDVTSWILNA
jgi:hypothetical protein